MKAFVLDDFDGGPAYRELPTPEAGASEVRVRVQASSVNGFDVAVAAGRLREMMEHEFPVTIGRDYAGVVDQVGAGITRYAVGDEVFGFVFTSPIHEGTWAEYLVVPEDMFISAKPANIGLIEAAALPLAGVAAMKAIEALDLSQGDRVLIVGATGGVGGYAAQLGLARGAHVIATTGPEDEERLRALGVQETIDFSRSDVAAVVRARYPDGVDALLDVVTPADGFAAVSDLVRDGGHVATTTGAADADALAARGIVTASVWASAEPEVLERLAGHADAGHLAVALEQVFPLAEAAAALEAFSKGTHGKIGISIGDGPAG